MKLYAQRCLLESRNRKVQLRAVRISDLEQSVENLESEISNFVSELYFNDQINELSARIDELEDNL